VKIRIAVILSIVIACIAVPAEAKFKTIYTFCTDGSCVQPETINVIPTPSGTLYGVTWGSGGTVFALVPNAKRTKWTYNRVWTFCGLIDCADGTNPGSGIIADAEGNLYGTTSYGGVSRHGTMFRLSPKGKKWTFTILYNFCSVDGCPDASPDVTLTYAGAASGAPYDGKSPLYVASSQFAATNGSLFSLTPGAEGELWTETSLHTFCLKKNCPDGSRIAAITADASGNLFGTMTYGGSQNAGTVFEYSGGKLTTLHSFCSPCTNEGSVPQGQIAIDAGGNVYGMTATGGESGYGTIYKLVPHGAKSTLSQLFNFCPGGGTCGNDGEFQYGGIVRDASGDLFGTMLQGGAKGGGTVFEWNGHFRVLYSFCTCQTDGDRPTSISVDGAGNLYGATLFGGQNDNGTIFARVK
jgi:uncharacterized repeat protein (TIGR03803 family)